MPTRSRKRQSAGQAYQTVQASRQTRFTPRNRTVSSKNLSPSARKTRQQTLTQIDFVSRFVPEDDEVDLAYVHDEAPRPTKRRKTVAESATPSRVQTRAARRLVVKEGDNERPARSTDPEARYAKLSTAPARSVKESIPPPETPRTVRKVEIPSSQSPADTPMSTQSGKSIPTNFRSPLKERSTNVVVQRGIPSAGKAIRQIPILEIQDTYDVDNEDIQMPSQAGSHGLQSSGSNTFRKQPLLISPGTGDNRDIDSISTNTKEATYPASGTHLSESSLDRLTQTIKSEIRDSDSDEDSENIQDDDFEVGPETQFALMRAASSPLSLRAEEDLNLPDRGADANYSAAETIPVAELWTPPSGLHAVNASHPEAEIVQLSSEDREGNPNTRALLPKPRSKGHPHYSDLPQSSTCNLQRSESEEVSAQLTNDLHRLTQLQHQPQSLLETESQFENAWRDYSPPTLSIDDGDGQDKPSRNYAHDFNTSTSPTLPPLPIPSSQATTVDITQPSPRTQTHPRDTQPSSSSLHANLPPLLSSSSSSKNKQKNKQKSKKTKTKTRRPHTPPPPFPLPPISFLPSSSPLLDTAAITRGAQGRYSFAAWDGKPLTESQLLPDSLMNDSLVGPPPLTQLTQLTQEEGEGEEME
ncbi:hypothetical protein MMC24_004078 [Lignoscripta atroalba]|nr:hypothetical protein [Lignoscripta atroalba]